MKLDDVVVGDKFWGIKYRYSFNFIKAIRVVLCEVTKVNSKTVGISYDKESYRHPQLFSKGKDVEVLNRDKRKLVADFLLYFESLDNHNAFCGTKKIIVYCKRQLRAKVV